MNDEVVRLYRIPDAARILAVSRDTVYRLIRAGELPAVERRSGSRMFMRIRADDLQAHIDGMPARSTPSHQ